MCHAENGALMFLNHPWSDPAIGLNPSGSSFVEFDQRATQGDALSVVFFGGSLTWGANASDPQRTSYRGLMTEYLREKYPRAAFTFHDAAIGGTGSKLGIFRLERDVLSRKPNLVFLDFSANDGLGDKDPQSLDSYETLLREMIGRGIAVEQVFFGFKFNFGKQYRPDTLHRLIDHRTLAAAYHTAQGDLFPLLQGKLNDGSADIETLWAIDGAHPDDPGYQVFFEAARIGFEQAVAERRVCSVPDRPVFSANYMNRRRIRLAEQPLAAGWQAAKTYRTSLWFDGLSSRWMGDVVMCDSKAKKPIEPLTIQFSGTFVGLFGEANQNGLCFKASIDSKPILYRENAKTPPTEIWQANTHALGEGRLFIWRQLADNLPPGEHTLVMEPQLPEPGLPDGQLRIESICVAGE